jgi:hypothetical protein
MSEQKLEEAAKEIIQMLQDEIRDIAIDTMLLEEKAERLRLEIAELKDKGHEGNSISHD